MSMFENGLEMKFKIMRAFINRIPQSSISDCVNMQKYAKNCINAKEKNFFSILNYAILVSAIYFHKNAHLHKNLLRY